MFLDFQPLSSSQRRRECKLHKYSSSLQENTFDDGSLFPSMRVDVQQLTLSSFSMRRQVPRGCQEGSSQMRCIVKKMDTFASHLMSETEQLRDHL